MPSKEKLAKMGVPSTKVTKIRADQLQPHPLAQREVVPARLKKLKDSLDLDAIGVLHVVQYPIKGQNGIWIIDGQHRWRALMDHGLGEWEVEVKVHLDQPSLAKKLAKYPGGPSGLIGDARGLTEFHKGSLTHCIAMRVIDTYNLSRRDGKLDPL